MNQPNSVIRCAKCGAANRDGARFCNNCGQPLSQIRTTAAGQKTRSDRNRGLLWAGGAIAILALLSICGVGGWIAYQKLTGTQATPSLIQSTPPGAITAVPQKPEATLVANTPTTTPTEPPANGYIFFASGDFDTGDRWEDNFVEGSWDLYVADTNGNNRKLLMHTTDDWTEGQFAPNGQWLWFEIDETSVVDDEYLDTRTVYVANADGSELRVVYTLSNLGSYFQNFEFSNDGWVMHFTEVRDHPDDPWFNSNDIIYNHRNGLVVDSGGCQVEEISSDSRWVLVEKGYHTSEGHYDSEEWSLVSMDTGQWKNFGRRKYVSFEFSPDEQNLIFHSHDDNPGYKIYNIATDSGTTLNFSGSDWLDFLPDGTHVFFEEENTLYLINLTNDDRSTYLQGHRYYSSYRGSSVLFFVSQRAISTNKIIIGAGKGTEDNPLPPDIYVANGDGTDLRIIAQDAQYATFLGDYQHVLLERAIIDNSENAEDLYSFSIIDLRSGMEYSLPGEFYRLPLELSPDGIHMLWHEYQLVPDEEYGGMQVDWGTYKLWLFNLNTMESWQLKLEGVNWDAYYANFSSDGSKIVYGVLEFADEGWSISNYATYVANLDGSGLKLINEKTFPIMSEHPLRD